VLKNPSNLVLGSQSSSTYLRMYASGAFSPTALLEGFLSALREKKLVVH